MKQSGKKTLLLFLCMVMLFSMITAVTFGAEASNEYFANGTGDGTEGEPYQITTADDIAKMAELFTTVTAARSAHYKLMNDLDLSTLENFQGLGTWNWFYFTGTFDGNGYVIKNMSIDSTKETDASQQNRPRGLFQGTQGATIKNLGIEGADVKAFPAAGIIGNDAGGSTVEGCYVRNSKFVCSTAGWMGYAGAIVGQSSDSATVTTIKNCYSAALIDMHANEGGIMGAKQWSDVSAANMINCYTTHGRLESNGSAPADNTNLTKQNCFANAAEAGVDSVALGAAYLSNDTDYNGGLPVLAWEESRMPERSSVRVLLEVGEDGAVSYNGQNIASGTWLNAAIGDDLTFTLIPDTDYQVEEVTVNGAVTEHENGTVTISCINTDTKIAVTFVHSKFGSLTKPDKTILQNVKDAYITKDGMTTVSAVYTFDTEADVNEWKITDEGAAVKSSTQSWEQSGANGTTGAYKHIAAGEDYRPRITGPDKINWNQGSKYVIKAWAKADSELTLYTWLNHGASIKTDFKPEGGAWLGLPSVALTTDWKEYTWEFEITEISQSGSSLPGVSVEYNARIAADNPEGTLWLDEISITEILPGYTKLGLMADATLLFPGESAPLTVVGNNGRASYKVKPEGLTFTSFDENVATVDANGVVTAKANGVTRIIVSDGEVEGAIDITVSDVNNAVSELHIALSGNDETGDGTPEAPFATIEKAKSVIQGYRRLPEGGVTVYLHEGEYLLSDTLTFTAEDSGTKDAPVIYKAYGDDDVDIVGSKKLDSSKVEKVTDEAILGRLIEDHAKDNLYMLDLGAQGVAMSALAPYGWNTVDTPSRIFMNGTGLYSARWPNDDKTGEQYFVGGEPAELSEADAAVYNGNNQPVVMKFADPDNRSAKWNVKSGDVLLNGAVAYLWAKQALRIDTLDAEAKTVKTLDPSAYGQNTHTPKNARYFYFSNLLEEIDMPGESYVDREKNILYFYPVGNVAGADMEISVLNKNLIEVKGASYITFDGINFRNSRRDAVNIDADSSSVTVKNAEISGMSGAGIVTYGSDVKIDRCHIYDLGAQAVQIYGGDRETLTSSGTELTNSRIHYVCHYFGNPVAAVTVEGVGHRIAHNELFDMNEGAIRYNDTNNTVTEYNKFYDCLKISADAGVLYWGRNVSEFGNIVRYNYFRDIGGNIGNYGQQSVFTDDGNIGVALYGNVFFNAGGGSPEYPIKTGDGQFHHIYNNIIIDSDYGSGMEWWGEYHIGLDDETIPGAWYAYMHDISQGVSDNRGNSNLFAERKALVFSDFWKEYYQSDEMAEINSQWKLAFDSYLNEDMYNEAKALYDAGNADGLRAWMKENLPAAYTNLIEKNVYVNVPNILTNRSVAVQKDNLQLSGAEGQGIFEDYGTDFSLTDDGLAKVRQTISDFPELDFDAMGLEYPVGGAAPSAADAYITGDADSREVLSASYSFSDADGDSEGVSRIYWYYSNSENGEYRRITDGYGRYFDAAEDYKGKYIKFEVVPYDSTCVYGEPVMSGAVYVKIEFPDAEARIAEIKAAADSAVVGSEPGNYPADAVSNLYAAIDKASEELETAKNTPDAEAIISTLERAFNVFKNRVVKENADEESDEQQSPSGGTSSGTVSGGGSYGGGSSSSSGNKVTYDGSQDNLTPAAPSATPAEFCFDDIVNHWSKTDVMSMYNAGIVSGVTATTFEPDRSITRAEFATLVAKALKLGDGEADFADVSASDWYAPFVGSAAKAGIIVGFDGSFRPDDTITREEMAVIIVKAMDYLGKSTEGEAKEFTDSAEVSEWAVPYVDKATAAGVISGMEDGSFAPKANATRAQAASLIARIIG